MAAYVYPHIDPTEETQVRGLELRDYFAAKAMQALIEHQIRTGDLQPCATAYQWADSMLEARKVPQCKS